MQGLPRPNKFERLCRRRINSVRVQAGMISGTIKCAWPFEPPHRPDYDHAALWITVDTSSLRTSDSDVVDCQFLGSAVHAQHRRTSVRSFANSGRLFPDSGSASKKALVPLASANHPQSLRPRPAPAGHRHAGASRSGPFDDCRRNSTAGISWKASIGTLADSTSSGSPATAMAAATKSLPSSAFTRPRNGINRNLGGGRNLGHTGLRPTAIPSAAGQRSSIRDTMRR